MAQRGRPRKSTIGNNKTEHGIPAYVMRYDNDPAETILRPMGPPSDNELIDQTGKPFKTDRRENTAIHLAGFEFDSDTIDRIIKSDEVYLVCKRKARLANGEKDKTIHDCLWLKEYYKALADGVENGSLDQKISH